MCWLVYFAQATFVCVCCDEKDCVFCETAKLVYKRYTWYKNKNNADPHTRQPHVVPLLAEVPLVDHTVLF